MLRKYRTVIVDDMPASSSHIEKILGSDPEIHIAGVYRNSKQAIDFLTRNEADILIQKTHMADSNGFDLLEAVGRETVPSVVFVAEENTWAAKAFDYNATDYITSPFINDRFVFAINKAKKHADWNSERSITDQLSRLFGPMDGIKKYPTRITVKNTDRVYFVNTSDIDFVEADGNYVALHAEGKKHLIRETMANMLNRLDPANFIRIHRSIIVNLNAVKELQPWFHGDYMVLLKNGKKLTMSRNFRKNMQLFLEQ